jgi:hypothetical protein
MEAEDGGLLELRNCGCGSTRAVQLPKLDTILIRASAIAGSPVRPASDRPANPEGGLCLVGTRGGLARLCAHFGFRYCPPRGREGVFLTAAKVHTLAVAP